MAYAIRRSEGWYLAPANSPKTYTPSLTKARKFATCEQAQNECRVEGEHVIEEFSAYDLIKRLDMLEREPTG